MQRRSVAADNVDAEEQVGGSDRGASTAAERARI